MHLPHSTEAIVELAKIRDYLLNAAHPDNGGKAAFFMSLGFRVEDWQRLADTLQWLATTKPVIKSMATPHGIKYVVDGRIESPSGRVATVRTIWIVDQGQTTPRLVTAYPRRK